MPRLSKQASSPKRQRLNDPVTDVSSSPRPLPPSHINDLPDEIFHLTAIYLGNVADLASMARTCRVMLARVQTLLTDLAPALNTRLSDSDLPERIHQFLENCQNKPQLRALVTPQMAVGLYDRLARYRFTYLGADRCSTAALDNMVRRLAVDLHPAVYGAWLHHCGRGKWPIMSMDLPLPDLNLPLPEDIVQLAHYLFVRLDGGDLQYEEYSPATLSAIAEVRGRYSAPFDRMFPFQHRVLDYFLTHLKPQNQAEEDEEDENDYACEIATIFATLLVRYDVVLALLQRGIRLGVDDYFTIVGVDNVPDLCRIYPLLDAASHDFDKKVLTMCVEDLDMEMFRQFLRVPNVLRHLRDHEVKYCSWLTNPDPDVWYESAFSYLSKSIVDCEEIGFLHILINLELITEFAPYLLKFCYKEGVTEWIDIILQLPEVRQNRDHHSYADALYNFIKYENPDSTKFYEVVNTEPFAAQYDIDMRLHIISALAFTGKQQLFIELLNEDPLLVERLGQNEEKIAQIFTETVDGTQECFLKFLLQMSGTFYGVIANKDKPIIEPLYRAVRLGLPLAIPFLQTVKSLPFFSDIVNTRCLSESTLLHGAFQSGNLDILELLLSIPGVNLYVTDGFNGGPMKHFLEGVYFQINQNGASWQRFIEKLPIHDPDYKPVIVSDLIDIFWWDVDIPDRQDLSELSRSILTTHSVMSEIINIRGKDQLRGTMLYNALRGPNYDAVSHLLSVPGLDLSIPHLWKECRIRLSNTDYDEIPAKYHDMVRDLYNRLCEYASQAD